MEPATILIVDDDALMLRLLLRPVAECEGIHVRDVWTATKPEDALALLAKAPPGPLAVISDFNLKAPMNGAALLAEAQRVRPDSVRILMSGYSREQLGDAATQGAAEVFVEKTLRLDEIVAPICRILVERLGNSSRPT